jgi:hypothetical protein
MSKNSPEDTLVGAITTPTIEDGRIEEGSPISNTSLGKGYGRPLASADRITSKFWDTG